MAYPYQFFPGCVVGWVVRIPPGEAYRSSSWWYGPGSGWGTTYGRLDRCVIVFHTKRDAQGAVRQVYGKVVTTRHHIERVRDAVDLAILEAQARKHEVLAGDRPDRQRIADANDEHVAYLRGHE